MRKVLLLLSAFPAFAGALLAQANVITLPAAASIVGGAPFFSDVRAFNTSYTDSLQVTATYRCFLGACPSTAPEFAFALSPRESQAFDDMVAAPSPAGFNAPNSAGGVEFSFTGASAQLVVTSRLFSTEPTPTVGMFIPGLGISEAYVNTILTSVRNAGPGAGFRTNVGAFNPGDASVDVTFTIFDGGAQAGSPVTRPLAGHTGLQVNAIFTAAVVSTLSTANAVIVVNATGPIFSYAAVIDNATTDPIFVRGAEDQPPQPVTPAATATPTPPAPTATRTPTPTPAPGQTATVNVGQGGHRFVDQQGGTSTTTINVGDTVHWVWVGGTHDTVSGTNCTPDGLWQSPRQSSGSFDRTFNLAGTFPYYCTPHCENGMTGTVIVNP